MTRGAEDNRHNFNFIEEMNAQDKQEQEKSEMIERLNHLPS